MWNISWNGVPEFNAVCTNATEKQCENIDISFVKKSYMNFARKAYRENLKVIRLLRIASRPIEKVYRKIARKHYQKARKYINEVSDTNIKCGNTFRTF